MFDIVNEYRYFIRSASLFRGFAISFSAATESPTPRTPDQIHAALLLECSSPLALRSRSSLMRKSPTKQVHKATPLPHTVRLPCFSHAPPHEIGDARLGALHPSCLAAICSISQLSTPTDTHAPAPLHRSLLATTTRATACGNPRPTFARGSRGPSRRLARLRSRRT
jgi:hypothetical protein